MIISLSLIGWLRPDFWRFSARLFAGPAFPPVCLYTQQCFSSERTSSSRWGRRWCRYPRRAEGTHAGARGRYPDGVGHELLVNGAESSFEYSKSCCTWSYILPILRCGRKGHTVRAGADRFETGAAGAQACKHTRARLRPRATCPRPSGARSEGKRRPGRAAVQCVLQKVVVRRDRLEVRSRTEHEEVGTSVVNLCGNTHCEPLAAI